MNGSCDSARAIESLLNLGLVSRDAHGCFRPRSITIRKDPRFASVHWANHMRAKSRLGTKAIERFPKDERDISEVYVPLSRENFEKVREDIAWLRRKILKLSEEDRNATRVYQCNVLVFPLTRSPSEEVK
ncbi:MAG: TIGR02147 family protein [Chitinivibrionales bacterium]|nr:TIGR02147 family protein [Chitinivibrionales bacterium]MBD3357866.1 TIGR02147 family protein [Chitinivibrionales bacterium]